MNITQHIPTFVEGAESRAAAVTTIWDSLTWLLSKMGTLGLRRLPSWTDNAQRPLLCLEEEQPDGAVIGTYVAVEDLPVAAPEPMHEGQSGVWNIDCPCKWCRDVYARISEAQKQ